MADLETAITLIGYCAKCGEDASGSWMATSSEAQTARKRGFCFDCGRWANMFERLRTRPRLQADTPAAQLAERSFIAQGAAWTIGTPVIVTKEQLRATGGMGVGFGGANWRIYFNDGPILDTNNLWSQGPISKAWLRHFPDEARLSGINSGAE